jgi:hypothetical protein
LTVHRTQGGLNSARVSVPTRAQNLDAFSSTTLVFDRYAVASDELTTAGNNLVSDPAPWPASAWTHRPVKGFRMLRFARAAAAVVVFAGALTFAQLPTSVAAPFDSFIVVYKDSVDEPAKTADLKRRLGFKSDFQYHHVIKGFAAILPPQVREMIAKDPDVAFISPDGDVQRSRPPSPSPPTKPCRSAHAGSSATAQLFTSRVASMSP